MLSFDIASLSSHERWYLVHTRPNNERRAEFHLGAQGFRTYYPQIEKTIRHIEMLREVRRRQTEAERAHAALSRHFSPELAKRLAASGESEGIEVQWRDIATIFTDITGFTSLVESAPPETLGALLNEYVGGMTEIVFAHEGTVAKIIGDAIQVLFNAPGDQPDYATRAVACAHDLDAWAEDFSARWKAIGVNFGTTRIGIHAGPALVGIRP